MEICSFGEEWLREIEFEIGEKYNISVVKFIIDDQLPKKEKFIIKWINNKLFEDKWVKYKHIKDDLFELKDFFPDPPINVCCKKVEGFIISIKKTYDNPYFKIHGLIYNEKEAKKELYNLLRSGFSEIFCSMISLKDSMDNKKRIILDTWVQKEEMFHQISSGYLVLEFKKIKG